MLKRNSIAENKSSLSERRSYQELGEYWDTHSLADHWDKTHAVEFELDVQSSAIYFPVDRYLAEELRAAASAHGVSPETLLNLWLQERVGDKARKTG